MTSLDISFLVKKYSQYISNPTLTHHAALKKIVQYFKRFKRLGLRQSCNGLVTKPGLFIRTSFICSS